jgi:sortase (surface protein transpeptidase)
MERVSGASRGHGNAIGEIQIPRIGLKAIVVQGESATILHRAVGTSALQRCLANQGTSCWRVIVTRSSDR